ncbi:MAG: DegT/DnrJ/EryC1/StrS family aminotransferase, partial [Planctomycetota bacterium]
MNLSNESKPQTKLAYGKQWISDADIAAVCEVLRGDWLTNGPAVKAFENALTAACGAKHAIACSSGTAALHLAMLVLDIGPRHTGVTSPLSFIASANAFAYVGARPNFVDIDPATRNLSVPGLKHYLQTRPAPAVVTPVSFSGVPAALPEIHALARQTGFK